MRVVPLQLVKGDKNYVRILCHHIISGVQIVVVSGNVFGIFYEYFNIPLKKFGLLSFCRFPLLFGSRIGVETFFRFQFEIAYVAIWTDVMSAKMSVMFRLLLF